MNKHPKIQEIVNENQVIRNSVRKTFATHEGRVALKYLMDRFYDCQLKHEHLERQAGSRDVLYHIKQIIEETPND